MTLKLHRNVLLALLTNQVKSDECFVFVEDTITSFTSKRQRSVAARDLSTNILVSVRLLLCLQI